MSAGTWDWTRLDGFRFSPVTRQHSNLDLAQLGWDDGWAKAWVSGAPSGCVPGRVALEHNHVFRVLTAEGEVLAETAGRVKHRAAGRHELPAVGDWVAVRPEATGRALIRTVLPRRSAFLRRAAGRETEQQVVAANIDTVFVVFGLDKPVNLRAIERYLAVALRSGARPVVVLNKSDLSADADVAVATAQAVSSDVPVIAVSARTDAGLEALGAWLGPGRTVALLGPSGVGKSSIVNRLVGREVLPTGEVRDWDARGRHTSVHRQLVRREAGGLIIDTPGMRELQLWESEGAVEQSFADVGELSAGCRFRDCRHDREPGCAVRAAVESGDLPADRYASFLKLQQEQDTVAEQRAERAIRQRREGRIGAKALKAMQKQRGR